MRGSLTAPQQTICTTPAPSLLPPSLPPSPPLSLSLCFCELSFSLLAVSCPISLPFYTFYASFSTLSLSWSCLSLYAFPTLTFLSLCPSLWFPFLCYHLSIPTSLLPYLLLLSVPISLFLSLFSKFTVTISIIPISLFPYLPSLCPFSLFPSSFLSLYFHVSVSISIFLSLYPHITDLISLFPSLCLHLCPFSLFPSLCSSLSVPISLFPSFHFYLSISMSLILSLFSHSLFPFLYSHLSVPFSAPAYLSLYSPSLLQALPHASL